MKTSNEKRLLVIWKADMGHVYEKGYFEGILHFYNTIDFLQKFLLASWIVYKSQCLFVCPLPPQLRTQLRTLLKTTT